MQQIDQIPEIAQEWRRAGQGVVIATVIETWGSAPRPVGSQLAISDAGIMAGSVSGGCVEGAVVAEALEMLSSAARAPKVLTFGVSDEDAFAVGLACGGQIAVVLHQIAPETWPDAVLDALVAARANRRAVAVILPLAAGGPTAQMVDAETFPDRARADQSGREGEGRFVALYNPPLRLIVVGAVHIAQALVPMARIAGYDPILIDPRPAFGHAARFQDVPILDDWPDAALAQIGIDARCAIVTLTHDSKLDDPAITTALRSRAFYLGCLGSTRTHAKRVERLTQAGFGADEIARIHAPVGLDIGAKSPAEIAVSILAEITLRLRRP